MACPFSKNNAWSIVFFACIALVLGVGLHVWNTHKPRMTQPTSATPLNQPQGLPAFSLIDSSNLPFTNRSSTGRYFIRDKSNNRRIHLGRRSKGTGLHSK